MENIEDYCIDKGTEDGWNGLPMEPPVREDMCPEFVRAYISAYWEARIHALGYSSAQT